MTLMNDDGRCFSLADVYDLNHVRSLHSKSELICKFKNNKKFK